jgi:uncharacterized protein YukE
MAGFSVYIGADTAQLAQGLSKAQADLLQFSNAIVVNSNSAANALAHIPAALRPINPAQMQALSNAVQKLKQDIQSAPASINATAAALNNLNKGASAANGAVLDFSRIVQDLPFGMVGIVNNLQQLPGSLQRLSAASKETGKSVGSLLLSSITGVGGLGLAVAAVTSGMLIYQNGIVGFTSKTKAAKDEAQKLAELLKSVKSAAETTFEGIGASQGQIVQVQALAAAVGDETRSQLERGRALEKLKSINKEYFGDLKLQEDSLRQLTPLVNEYTNALIQQAVVSELQSEIGKIGAVFVKQAQAVSNARDALNSYKDSLNTPALDQAGNRVFVLDNNLDALTLNLKKAQDTLAPTAQKFGDLTNALRQATVETLKYRATTSTPDKKEEDLLKKRLEALEKIKAVTKDATALVGLQEAIFELQVKIAVRDQGKNKLSKQELDQQLKGYQDQLNEAFKNQAIELESIPKVRFSSTARLEINDIISKAFTSKDKIIIGIGEKGLAFDVKKESVDITDLQGRVAKATGLDKKIPIRTEFEIDVALFGLKTANFKKAVREIKKNLLEQVKDVFSGGLTDVFSGLGEGLGESFAEAITGSGFGDGLKKAAQSILSIVGNVMQQLGRALIAAAIKIKLLKETFEKFAIANPALAIVAGIGLVAAGALIKNIKFDGPKFATGGIVTGPVIGQIGEMHRPEVIMPLDRLPQMLRSIGGAGAGETQPVLIFTNEGLYLQMKRGERRANRKF